MELWPCRNASKHANNGRPLSKALDGSNLLFFWNGGHTYPSADPLEQDLHTLPAPGVWTLQHVQQIKSKVPGWNGSAVQIPLINIARQDCRPYAQEGLQIVLEMQIMVAHAKAEAQWMHRNLKAC